MDKKLNIIATVKDGIAIALVNYLSLIAASVLYLITIWIPYLNVGTTIAMCSLPAEMAKGNIVNPLFIFNPKYRRHMGEFFILVTLMSGAISIGYLFGGIPGVVIGIAWSFATVLFVDKDMPALEALRESNRITYGNKWRIFGSKALLVAVLCVATSIISLLFGIGSIGWLQTIGLIINIIIIIFFIPAIYGLEASIYKQLTSGEIVEKVDIPNPFENQPAPAAAAPAPAPAPEAPAEEKKPAAKKPAARKPKAE